MSSMRIFVFAICTDWAVKSIWAMIIRLRDDPGFA